MARGRAEAIRTSTSPSGSFQTPTGWGMAATLASSMPTITTSSGAARGARARSTDHSRSRSQASRRSATGVNEKARPARASTTDRSAANPVPAPSSGWFIAAS